MAVRYGLEKYHQYVYGQDVTVEMDHKPLLGILRKPLADVPPWIQRMPLRCLRYQFHLQYRPGKEVALADALSRAPSSTVYSDHDHLTEKQIASVSHLRVPTPLGQDRCQVVMSQYPTMQMKHYMQSGWPEYWKSCSSWSCQALLRIWGVWHDLTKKDGMLFKGSQAVVLLSLRGTVLSSIHDGHLGIGKCMERAKN